MRNKTFINKEDGSGGDTYNMDILNSTLPELFDLPEMTFELDRWGTVRRMNHKAMESTGYSESDIANGLTLYELIPDKYHENLDRDLQTVKHGGRINGADYEMKLRDGRILPILVTAGLVAAGTSMNVTFSAMDMSGHKEMEKELIILEKLSALGELAGGVVHDFNNILAVILGYIHLHEKACPEGKCGEALSKIKSTAKDGIEMVKRLQYYTQVNVELNRERMDVNRVIEESLEAVRIRLGENDDHPERISFAVNPGTTPVVLANSAEMHEIFINILNNAVESIRDEGTVAISTGSDHGFAKISISDSGIGMSDEVRKRIFEPFFTTKERRGTGLGMSVLFGIINKMGGSIEIESAPGNGTSISIFLPGMAEGSPVQTNSGELELKDSAATSSGILIVDDEANICEILYEFLNSEGYQVTTASNGETGLALFREHRFGIVITDLFMPGISGWDMAAKIREECDNITIILLSGWSAEFVERNKAEKLIDFFVDKPIDFKKLLELIAGIATDGANK